jgi:hypothetical protein
MGLEPFLKNGVHLARQAQHHITGIARALFGGRCEYHFKLVVIQTRNNRGKHDAARDPGIAQLAQGLQTPAGGRRPGLH